MSRMTIQYKLHDFKQPMRIRVQIKAIRKIISMLQKKKHVKAEIIKSLAGEGLNREESEDALDKLAALRIIYEDYGRREKRYRLSCDLKHTH